MFGSCSSLANTGKFYIGLIVNCPQTNTPITLGRFNFIFTKPCKISLLKQKRMQVSQIAGMLRSPNSTKRSSMRIMAGCLKSIQRFLCILICWYRNKCSLVLSSIHKTCQFKLQIVQLSTKRASTFTTTRVTHYITPFNS